MDIPASSRIIRLLFDYHHLLQQGKSTGEALFVLDQRSKWYDGVLLHAFIDILGDAGKNRIRTVYPLGLTTGMEIAEDVYGVIDAKKRKILSCGEILTEETIDYLQRHSEDILDITEPIKIVMLFVEKGSEYSAQKDIRQAVNLGMYVSLREIPWFNHPFLLSHFELKKQSEINDILAIGCDTVLYDPKKSRTKPLAEEHEVAVNRFDKKFISKTSLKSKKASELRKRRKRFQEVEKDFSVASEKAGWLFEEVKGRGLTRMRI